VFEIASLGSGTASVYWVDWNGSAYAPDTDSTDTMRSPLGSVAGWARNGSNAGRRGLARKMFDAEDWEEIPGPVQAWGKLDADLTAGNSAAVSIYVGGVDIGENVTAYAPPVMASGTLASGDDVLVVYLHHESKWYVLAAEC
jgi:hypothetical protein